MNARNLGGTTALLGMFLLLCSLAWLGCDDAQAPLDPRPNEPGQSLEADPLEDALLGSDGQVAHELNRRITRFTEILELDAVQAQALATAYRAYCADMEDPHAETRSGFEAELQIILTEVQYDYLQQLRQLRYQHRHAHRDAAHRWADWAEEIGASAEQFDLILGALETLRNGIAGVRTHLRDGDLDHEEAYAAAQNFRSELNAALGEILSPEQYEALMALRPDTCPRP